MPSFRLLPDRRFLHDHDWTASACQGPVRLVAVSEAHARAKASLALTNAPRVTGLGWSASLSPWEQPRLVEVVRLEDGEPFLGDEIFLAPEA